MVLILTLAAVVATALAVVPIGWEAFLRIRAGRRELMPRTVALSTFKEDLADAVPPAETSAASDRLAILNAVGHSVLVVVPTVERDVAGESAVPLEDVRATEEILALMREESQGRPYVEDVIPAASLEMPCRRDLILVGSGWGNLVVESLLHEPGFAGALGVEFVGSKEDRTSRRLVVEGQSYESPYSRQVQEYRADPTSYADGFTDFGVVAFTSNPWDPSRTLVLVAGIRALGTWGAAWHLHRHASELKAEAGDERHFTALVRAHRDNAEKVWLETSLERIVYGR